MAVDPQAIKAMISEELSRVADRRVVDFINQRLVEPTSVLRLWPYSQTEERFPCWTVLTCRGVGVAYCEHGFGPERPWGLVWLEGDYQQQSTGDDSGWFATFVEAVKDSALSDLPVWRVFESPYDSGRRAMTEEADWDTTWKEVERFRAAHPGRRYDCDTDVL